MRAGRLGVGAGIAAFDGADGLCGARERGLGKVGGVGVAHRLVLDGAQAKTLGGVVGRLLEPAVVENQHFRLAIFEEEFAVVGPLKAAGEVAARIIAVEAGAVE